MGQLDGTGIAIIAVLVLVGAGLLTVGVVLLIELLRGRR